jgi:copper chaperone CopZ
MKAFFNVLFAAMIVFALVFTSSLANDKEEIKIKTSAYSWMCKNKIESKINKMEGVDDCELDLATKTITVIYDSNKISLDKIVSEIEDIGYDAEIKPDSKKIVNTEAKEKQK